MQKICCTSLLENNLSASADNLHTFVVMGL